MVCEKVPSVLEEARRGRAGTVWSSSDPGLSPLLLLFPSAGCRLQEPVWTPSSQVLFLGAKKLFVLA